LKAELTCEKCRQTIVQATAKYTRGLCIRCYRLAKTGRKTIQLECKGCCRKYILGVDAVVTTPEETISKVGAWLGGGPTAGLYPDVVGPAERPGHLNDEQIAKDQEAIRVVQEAMKSGTSRKWRCFKCGRVQEYSADTL